jgi:hypothetical protein
LPDSEEADKQHFHLILFFLIQFLCFEPKLSWEARWVFVGMRYRSKFKGNLFFLDTLSYLQCLLKQIIIIIYFFLLINCQASGGLLKKKTGRKSIYCILTKKNADIVTSRPLILD